VKRTVSADLEVHVADPAHLAFQVGVSTPELYGAQEDISLTLGGRPVDFTEVAAPSGGRIWALNASAGIVSLHYFAQLADTPPPPPVEVADDLLYRRPSRYCESDRMLGLAAGLFPGITEPGEILAAVSSWVGTTLDYVTGSSGPTDGAVETLLAGRGVCRDYAHLAVSLLRALDIPARLAAVYAPGLFPMDFHAVAEALVDGAWQVVDGTLLAPRSSLVRIATGRDAADTSFLSNHGGEVTLNYLQVSATTDGDLPADDVHTLVSLR
jgi:transglutaminase-like putative cysteine protease